MVKKQKKTHFTQINENQLNFIPILFLQVLNMGYLNICSSVSTNKLKITSKHM